jgi:hypothetical protein
MNVETEGTRPKKVKKTTRKQSPETIAKRIATMKARKAAREGNGEAGAPDVVGAIAALRKSKRSILKALCSQELKDLGDIELGVFEALRHLQGG